MNFKLQSNYGSEVGKSFNGAGRSTMLMGLPSNGKAFSINDLLAMISLKPAMQAVFRSARKNASMPMEHSVQAIN